MARQTLGLVRDWVGALLFEGSLTAHADDPLKIYVAGSLAAALKEVIAASGLPASAVAPRLNSACRRGER